MSAVTMPVTEHLFDETLQLTSMIEYGVSWQALTSGEAKLPPQGARFDIGFEGPIEGPRIKGILTGLDFLTVRADGRFMLDLHATITTDDGEKIAVAETGLLIPPQDESRIAQLRLNMEFSTTAPKYAWLNEVQGWGRGIVNWNDGSISISAYVA